MKWVCVVSQQNADIADTLHVRDVAMATTFWLSMSYNFSCMIASDMLYIKIGGCAPFAGEMGPHLTQCGRGRGLPPC